MKRYFLIAWIAISLTLFANSTLAFNSQVIDVQLIAHSKKGQFPSSVVTVTIRNLGAAPVYLPKIQTPIFTPADHLQGDLFTITDDEGKPARFIGRYVRIIPEDPDTYFLKLAPGESTTHDLDLGVDYDLSKGGEFSVKYDQRYATKIGLAPNGEIDSNDKNQTSEIARIWVDLGHKTSLLTPADTTPGAVCSDDNMKLIRKTQVASVPLVLKAYQAIKALYYNEEGKDKYGQTTYTGKIKPDNAYTYWFGAPVNKNNPELSSRNYVDYWKTDDDYVMIYTINSVYSRSPGGSFVCGCDSRYDPRTAAWTEEDSQVIHLCDRYFALPFNNGPNDSQLLTLIHEVSHFHDSYAPPTADYEYGMTKSHALPDLNRHNAVRNADSIMYYIGTFNTSAP